MNGSAHERRSYLGIAVVATCMYIVACVVGFLTLASDGHFTSGLSPKQFALLMFVVAPLFVVVMAVLEGMAEAVVEWLATLVRRLRGLP